MSDPTLDFDVLSILAKNTDAIAASAPVSLAPQGPVAVKQDIVVGGGSPPAEPNLNDSALAVIDQWTEKSEKEEAMDHWTSLNNAIPAAQQEANSEAVTDFDSAMDAVEKWTQEQEEDANVEENTTPSPRSDFEDGSEMSIPTVATVVTLTNVNPEPEKQAQEMERLRNELTQAQQEIEALETSTNLYRMQLKQAKEMQRVRSLEVEQVKNNNDQALEHALQVQNQLQGALATAQDTQNQLKVALDSKEQEIIRLKLDNHEYPSKILKLQSDLEAERAKFKSLVDRFNSIKELELHRQKQKFLSVSSQQKEVFDRLHSKYTETVQIAKSQTEQISLLQQQLAAKDKEMGKIHALFNQARQEIANERAKFLQLKSSYDNLKAEFDKECATKQAVITEIEQKLQTTESEVRSMKEREQEQQRMQCYFDCAHNNEPEIGDDIRVVSQDCGEIASFEWFRAASAGSAHQLIEGQTRDVYTATADDLGRLLKLTLTNTVGLSVSAEIGPIALPASLAPKLHEYLLFKKEIDFPVKSSTSASKNGRSILLTKDKIKLREGKTTLVKELYGPNVAVVLDAVDDMKFTLKLGMTAVQQELFAESPSARNTIAMTVRSINYIISTKQPYKEKEPNPGFIQYLLSVVSQRTIESNFAVHKSRLSQMGSFSQKFPLHQTKSNAMENPSISRHASADFRSPQDAAPSSRSLSLKPTNEEEQLEYDADGYIIRRDVEGNITDTNDANALGVEDQSQPSIPPIVIKPKNEAVESTPEELSRAALKFDKPPTASTSKPKPAPSEDKQKKKKKKEKPDESTTTTESSATSSPTKT